MFYEKVKTFSCCPAGRYYSDTKSKKLKTLVLKTLQKHERLKKIGTAAVFRES